MATVLGLSHQTSLGTQAEELEGVDHAFEDRLGAFEGERQHEGSVGVGPGRHEKGDQAPTVGELDVDMSEIGLEPPTRQVSQGDERLPISTSVLEHVALYLGIPAAVAVLVAEPSEELGGGVPLLGRGGLVVDEDLVDRPPRQAPTAGRTDPGLTGEDWAQLA